MEFKAIYHYNNEESTELGVFDSKEKAINSLLKKGDGNYCLDDYKTREKALIERNFCMCGCGPACMEIIEV